jgi:hypothetical protein
MQGIPLDIDNHAMFRRFAEMVNSERLRRLSISGLDISHALFKKKSPKLDFSSSKMTGVDLKLLDWIISEGLKLLNFKHVSFANNSQLFSTPTAMDYLMKILQAAPNLAKLELNGTGLDYFDDLSQFFNQLPNQVDEIKLGGTFSKKQLV